MKFLSRRLWIGALMLTLFSSSCNLPAQSPAAPVGTILPGGQTATVTLPTNTVTGVTPTVFIPVTGSDAVSLQCQFCVNDETHALLIMPERASFLVSDPVIGINCLTAKVINGQRIVLCRGAQQTTFTLSVCLDDSNCVQFPIALQACPLNPQSGVGKPGVTSIPFTPNAPPAIDTQIPPTVPANPSIPTATMTNAPSLQPTRGTHPLPSLLTPQPGAAQQEPAE